MSILDPREIDLRQISYFVAVAEVENISQAAHTLHVSQPVVSRQMRALEDKLGWQLFERRGKSISLTREGAIVAREGAKLLKVADTIAKRMTDEIEGAELRVGYAPSLAEGVIDRAVRCLARDHPRVRVTWWDASTREMLHKLHAGELDFAFEVATDDPGIEWRTVREREFRIMVPIDHPLARRRWARPGDLDGERLLLLSRHEYPGYFLRVTQYFAEHGVNAKVAGEFDGGSSLRMGVEAGLGIAFVSDGILATDRVRIMKLKPPPDNLHVAIGWQKGRALSTWEKGFLEAMGT